MRLEYFEMIDRFLAVDARARTIRTACTVPASSPVFEGHFPGFPLMPGVLLIECMAQTCGWMTSAIKGFSGLPALAGVKEAKLREPVFPGYRLEFDGHIIHDGSGFAMAECQGRREGKVGVQRRVDLSDHPLPVRYLSADHARHGPGARVPARGVPP